MTEQAISSTDSDRVTALSKAMIAAAGDKADALGLDPDADATVSLIVAGGAQALGAFLASKAAWMAPKDRAAYIEGVCAATQKNAGVAADVLAAQDGGDWLKPLGVEGGPQ